MKLVLLLALLFAVTTAQVSSLFDDFTTFSTIDANANMLTATTTASNPNILGTRRDLSLTVQPGSNPALEASCTIVGGFFALSTDVSVVGACTASYNGPDDMGFDTPVNYNAFGCDCWNMRIIESDNNVGFEITANSRDFGPQTSSLMLAVDISDPLDVCIPFEGDREAYNDIISVDFQIEGRVANVDVNLQSVCCQPSVTCVHTITGLNGADVDNLIVGDDIKLSIMCRNYESQPADLQDITVSFPFDSGFGVLDAGSIMCDGDVDPISPGVVNNALEFQASLIDGESINCMVDVALIAGGSVDNIAANIFTSQGDPRFPFQSNTDIDRQGTLEFCELPVPASLVIIDPPTTLPPTTRPPTTLPPTTLPPTTEPPTTEPPTTEPPTTQPPTTLPPTTLPPTTLPPTTLPPTTLPPTTEPPTTEPPTTEPPTTEPPTTEPPTTEPPTTEPPTTEPPTTQPPTTLPPTTLPPTTLPPTTLPPTTLPPTTLPPTTLPPTTVPPTPVRFVCVSPRIINGECDCQTFPCFEADDGSNSFRCETDEWYCWFVARIPASGRFQVGYRGQMCYCEI